MKQLRKWFRLLHRDFGYFFFGTTIIYAISGIALNHRSNWNPNYIITNEEVKTNTDIRKSATNKQIVLSVLSEVGEQDNFKNYYYPSSSLLKIFIKDGAVTYDVRSGLGVVEKIRKRPFFNQVNYLHYNPIKWWTWFSDIYAVVLALLAITGLFLARGKNSITAWHGATLTILGILIPISFLLFLKN